MLARQRDGRAAPLPKVDADLGADHAHHAAIVLAEWINRIIHCGQPWPEVLEALRSLPDLRFRKVTSRMREEAVAVAHAGAEAERWWTVGAVAKLVPMEPYEVSRRCGEGKPFRSIGEGHDRLIDIVSVADWMRGNERRATETASERAVIARRSG